MKNLIREIGRKNNIISLFGTSIKSLVNEPLASSVQIFEGNSHYDTPEVRRFDEIVAQFIRVFPERWSPAGIGMRMEVLGCDLPGKNISQIFDSD